jgi:hypothetical protein
MLAMGYSDVMPLSMLQHVQINLEEYRNNGKKSRKTANDEFEDRSNTGVRVVDVICECTETNI